MKEIAPDSKSKGLQKGVPLVATDTDRLLHELQFEVDQLRLELTALKNFMKAANPSFAEQFPQLLEKTIHDVDTETH